MDLVKLDICLTKLSYYTEFLRVYTYICYCILYIYLHPCVVYIYVCIYMSHG